MRIGYGIWCRKHIIPVAMLNDDLIAVSGSVQPDSKLLRTNQHAWNRLFNVLYVDWHVMVSDNIHQGDACIHDFIECGYQILVVLDVLLVELPPVNFDKGERQEPLIKDVTVEHHFPNIRSHSNALQEFDEIRSILQNLRISIFKACVKVTEHYDLVACASCLPKRLYPSHCCGILLRKGRTANEGHHQQCNSNMRNRPFYHGYPPIQVKIW